MWFTFLFQGLGLLGWILAFNAVAARNPEALQAPPPHPDPAVCGGHWPHALPNSHDLISSPKKLYLLF